MKTCYIHIGVHKTASTSIQHWIATHEAALFHHGILVPASGRVGPNIAAHHHLAFDLNNDSRLDPTAGGVVKLLAELKVNPKNSALISSEDFSFSVLDSSRLQSLRQRLTEIGYRCVWIVYLRSAASWLDSAYAEMSKALLIRRKFGPWLEESARSTLAYQLPSLISALHATKDEVKIRSFAIACKKGLGSDFLNSLDLEDTITDWGDVTNSNERPQALWVEFFRLLSYLLVRHSLMKTREEFVVASRHALHLMPSSPSFVGMTDALAASVDNQTRADYEAILREIRFSGNYEDFFPAQSFVSCEVAVERLAPKELHSINRAIVYTLMRPKKI